MSLTPDDNAKLHASLFINQNPIFAASGVATVSRLFLSSLLLGGLDRHPMITHRRLCARVDLHLFSGRISITSHLEDEEEALARPKRTGQTFTAVS
jgi:hypothetical protein